MNELNAAWQAAATEMYQSTGGQPTDGANPGAGASGGAGSGSASQNDVSDVEYEEVNDNKK
jgi:molecular chaperone DnaK